MLKLLFRLQPQVITPRNNETVACGISRPSVMTEPQGTFTSNGYPDPYPTDTLCEWLIESTTNVGVPIGEIPFADLSDEVDSVVFFMRTLFIGAKIAQAKRG